jgi:8-oxo-dGTP pyrophosphatase MutT (NUDIX family)
MTDNPIPAATVLLLRDEPAFEVLMVERHANIGFAGGALVFPGGRIDPGDRNPAWTEHSAGCDPALMAGEIAAIREAFEEAGILLAREAGAGPEAPLIDGERAAALGDWRAVVEQDDAQFLELIRREGLKLACDKLRLFAHWIAPPGLHRRFDTLFFACICPEGQAAHEDGNEATEALWISPAGAVAARERGERKIIFPTLCNLRLLGLSNSASEVFDFARRRKIAPVQPTIEMREGEAFLCIPQDMGYPVTSEKIDASLQG